MDKAGAGTSCPAQCVGEDFGAGYRGRSHALKPAELQPYIDHMLQCFGPARMLFGSDWPVVELAGTYERWVAAAVAATSHLPAAQQDDIFVNNAARVYRLA